VPFGNARIEGGAVVCQHGAEECGGNSWEQCAISIYPAFSEHWPFYLCLEQKLGSDGTQAVPLSNATAECTKSSGLSYEKLKACVDDPARSFALQKKFAAMTPSHPYVPYVLINGKLSPSDGEQLLKEVCQAYTGTPPAGCAQVLEAAARKCTADW